MECLPWPIRRLQTPALIVKKGDCRALVSARVAGKTLESRDKGARGRGEDKTGHSGMNIHRKGCAALCMHGNRTKTQHTVCCICTQASHVQKKNNISLTCKSIKSPQYVSLFYIIPIKTVPSPAAETQHSPAHTELFTSRNENSSEKCFSEKKAKRIIICWPCTIRVSS